MLDAADLPDVAALKAILIAAQVREAAKDVTIASKEIPVLRQEPAIVLLHHVSFTCDCMAVRTTTSSGTVASIATTKMASVFARSSPAVIINWSITRADGILARSL